MEIISFEGWDNCIRLYNEEVELIITTEVGPRILHFGYINGQNLLYIFPDDKGKKGEEKFRYYGGHRLWHSPEVFPRTYAPDNSPVAYNWDGKTLTLFQETEKITGIAKEIQITLSAEPVVKGSLNPVSDPLGSTVHHSPFTIHSVHLEHRLINKNLWDIELAPWAITAFAPGGRAIIPQEPYIDPADCMLPSRPMVLWHYTQMNDPHWTWGKKYIQLKQDTSLSTEQKLGILNKQKWCAYYLNGELFIKTFDYDPHATYADYGCNNEVWADGTFLELETLGPLSKIPAGGMIQHQENWLLSNVQLEEHEDLMDQKLLPLLSSSEFI